MTVYLDIIFLENIIINYIILYATSIISRAHTSQIRLIGGATFGAIYSVIYYVFRLKIYSSFIIKVILSIIIIYIAFNSKNFKDLIKKIVLFYLVSFVFGGAAIAIIYMASSNDITIQNGVLVGNYTIKTILIGIVVAYFIIMISSKIIRTKISKKDLICDISVKLEGKIIKTKAMIDTGNLLKEPITNLPVIIMEHTLLYEVLPKQILNNIENILGGEFSGIPKDMQEKYIPKIRVIPFSSLEKTNGMLLGIKANNLVINLKEETKVLDKVIIGIYNKSLTKRGEYRSLLGLEVI